MSADLVAWLLERIAEDEQRAQAATAGPWRHNPDKHWRKPGTAWFEEAVFAGPAGEDAICVAGTGETDDRQSMADADHIATWDPARVLAECDAKRRIVTEHQSARAAADADPSDVSAKIGAFAFEIAMRAAAVPLADRPGYREEWRP
jgi:hypothetical protein